MCWDLGIGVSSVLKDESEFSQAYGSTSARAERSRERACGRGEEAIRGQVDRGVNRDNPDGEPPTIMTCHAMVMVYESCDEHHDNEQ